MTVSATLHHVARCQGDIGGLHRYDSDYCMGRSLYAKGGARRRFAARHLLTCQAMYRGVELDTQRLQERRQRMQDLERNRERERELRAIQPIDNADKKIHQESLKRLA